MSCGNYFAKSHRLLVISPFWAKKGTVYMRAGTRGRVMEGQNLYGYVTVEFRPGRRRIRERSVVTDYSMYVEDLNFEG
jgi:hypothetical protein